MKTYKELLEEIRIEDELPSEAGQAFKKLINAENNSLGYRELKIIADWLNDYLNMYGEDKEKLQNEIINE